MQTVDISERWPDLGLPAQITDVLQHCKSLLFPRSREEVLSLAMGGQCEGLFEVAYEVPRRGRVMEATVAKCSNGLAVNYTEPYMRRRDPDCSVIGDEKPTDKQSFRNRFGEPFEPLRGETFQWLKDQDLVVFAFILGGFDRRTGHGALLIAPKNAGFFIGGLGDLQEMLPPDQVPENFRVRAAVYVAPPFRHTHFEGKQVVVHYRTDSVHEVFSYNLYPGPSAKKGIYGVLLAMGEDEEWLTLHASTVQVVTPYDNITTIMHEGASGSGKSEMLEYVHRQEDGRLLLGRNTVTGEERRLVLNQACGLCPVTDDMAMCHPDVQNAAGYLRAYDAEQAWFVRVDHIRQYGTDPHLEELTVHAREPLIFLNLRGVPGATCLIWEHTEDTPGVPCPNPRVILPRRFVPNVVNETVEVMIRNFGVRTPPCTADCPTYGIVGYLHILPPALAWLWRLVAPRGYANPSITDSAGLASEGVGSYWPFATGRIVDHANLLLRQIQQTPKVRYTLTPNQHVGAWSVGFMPEWIAREYLGRRGIAKFPASKLQSARCPLLGYTLQAMQVEGTIVPVWLLRVDEQPEVGAEGYDDGAEILREFFLRELRTFLQPGLDDLGRQIIECCRDGGSVEDYEAFLPSVDLAP
ncbi:MAG: DUF4914 family protein [Pirellulaceae bacterium]